LLVDAPADRTPHRDDAGLPVQRWWAPLALGDRRHQRRAITPGSDAPHDARAPGLPQVPH